MIPLQSYPLLGMLSLVPCFREPLLNFPSEPVLHIFVVFSVIDDKPLSAEGEPDYMKLPKSFGIDSDGVDNLVS